LVLATAGDQVAGPFDPSVAGAQRLAGKEIVANRYRFSVEIRLPMLGRVLSYSGTLDRVALTSL